MAEIFKNISYRNSCQYAELIRLKIGIIEESGNVALSLQVLMGFIIKKVHNSNLGTGLFLIEVSKELFLEDLVEITAVGTFIIPASILL